MVRILALAAGAATERRSAQALPGGATDVGADGEPVLRVTVSDPVAQGDGVNAHVSYRVSTETTLPSFQWKHFSVVRRFRDFASLHQRLSDAHPGLVIPALPEKRMATKLVSLGPEFVAQRCAALDAFLKRCAAHATLRASPHLAAFLEAPEGAWAAQAAVPLPRDALTLAKQREAQGPLGAAALKELGRNAAALLAGRPDANDAEYDRMRAYFTELDSHLTECQQSIDKLIRRQGKLAGALKDFGVAMGELGKSQSGDAASSLAALAQCCASLAASSGAKAVAMQASVDVPMRDLVRSLQGVRGALSARHAAHTTHLATLQELEGKRLKLAKLREGGKADAARLAGEERDAAQAATQADTARHEYGELCERMAAELLRADAQRAQQLATVTRALGIAQRELAADQAAAFDLMRTVRAAT